MLGLPRRRPSFAHPCSCASLPACYISSLNGSRLQCHLPFRRLVGDSLSASRGSCGTSGHVLDMIGRGIPFCSPQPCAHRLTMPCMTASEMDDGIFGRWTLYCVSWYLVSSASLEVRVVGWLGGCADDRTGTSASADQLKSAILNRGTDQPSAPFLRFQVRNSIQSLLKYTDFQQILRLPCSRGPPRLGSGGGAVPLSKN